MVKGSLLTLLSLIFMSGIFAFAQDKPDPAAQAKPATAEEQPAGTENQATSLQKAVQNPVASLLNVPIQNNSNFNIGPYDRTQDVLNIQPVIPAQISTNWNLITRINSADRVAAVSQCRAVVKSWIDAY